MKRRFDDLRRDGDFDLVVVGGGLHGAWVAWDATLRGFAVAVVEAEDWGSGGPAPTATLIHGGLAALEHGRLATVRRRLAERRALWRLGPHRVRPLPLVLPAYGGSAAARARTRAGLWLYDRLAGARRPVGPPERLTAEACRRRYRFLERGGLSGAFVLGECSADDHRLTIELIDGAAERGAVVVNRAPALSLLREGGRIAGVRVADDDPPGGDDGGDGPTTVDVAARFVVVAGSAPEAALFGAEREGKGLPRRRSTYAVLPALPLGEGLVVPGAGIDDVVLVLPWHGRTLVCAARGDEEPGLERLLARANRALGKIRWTASHVISTFESTHVVTGAAGIDGPAAVERHGDGCVALLGGGMTGARLDARRAVDAAARSIGRRAACRTGDEGLPWSPGRFLDWRHDVFVHALDVGLDEATAEACRRRYGSRIERLFGLIDKLPRLARRFLPDHPYCYGELVMAGLHEMARGLDDVLLRRVPLARIERLSSDTVAHAAEIVGTVFGWSEERRGREIAALRPGGRRRRARDRGASRSPLDETDRSS